MGKGKKYEKYSRIEKIVKRIKQREELIKEICY